MGTARFGKVLTAMVTPFTDGGDLDLDGAAALARWLVAQGNDGLVLAGTTGEAPTLTDDEKVALWRAVRDAVDVPLLAGSGSYDTRHSVELSRRAAETGVDGLLVVSPYYNRPPQAGIEAHFRAVAAATDLPVVMYDVPSRTARAIAVDTIVRLATEVPNIVGLKDARGNPGEAARIVAGAPHDFDLYSGDDSLTLALLAVGAVGVVGVCTHWSAGLHAEMIAAHGKGDIEAAREINARLGPSFAVETSETWVHTGAAKAALELLGRPAGPCRLPLPPLGDDVRSAVRRVLDGLGLTEPAAP
ncbi:MAG TPA: 4-hydroxy-tetrahydrodipicolinate synthase [Acidimicrobiales bacterium]|nr:4-hydroxy-tetrahydrodipicolinate synthase [Acidimicrobiales bacterium]